MKLNKNIQITYALDRILQMSLELLMKLNLSINRKLSGEIIYLDYYAQQQKKKN